MSIEAMKQALEALEQLQGGCTDSGCTDSDDGTVEAITVWCPEVIDALRQAIEQAEQQEGTVMAEYKFQTYAVYKKDGETKIGVMPEPEQEPVAWRDMAYANLGAVRDKMPPGQVTAVQDWLEKVYTTPPQRQFVGLTDEEREFLLHQALRFYDTDAQLLSFIKTVEAKLKEKNT
jgi:hypothetical protein